MTDNFQSIPPYQAPPPPPAQKSNRTILIVAIVVGALCLCTIACIAVIALGGGAFLGIGSSGSEKAPVEDVLTAYMVAMEGKYVEGAYALFSPRAQSQFASTDLVGLIEGDNYQLFQGFDRLSVTEIEISVEANIDQNAPQGSVATVSGGVFYDGGYEGTFEAILEKVDDTWRIHNVTVAIP